MPSSQKTSYLGLNRWNGTDKPKRTDWNADNDKIDTAVQTMNNSFANHVASGALHITQGEKDRWNEGKSFLVYNYTGNANATRTINLGIKPNFAIVFAVNKPPIANYPNFKCYSGFMSTNGCSDGLTLASSGFNIYHDVSADPTGYAVALNENNTNYICIYW